MDGSKTPVTLEAADIATILRAIPHRYPFLLIDRIRDLRGEDGCIGIKNVTANEPQFMGHFPGQPVFPGVLIIEGMAQAAGVTAILARKDKPPPKSVFFLTIDKAKFRRPAVPGDVLEYHMVKIAKRKTMGWFRGEAMVNGQVIAEAEIGVMLVDE